MTRPSLTCSWSYSLSPFIGCASRPVPLLRVGDTVALVATRTGLDAVVRPYPFAWLSSDSARLSVTPDGHAVARAPGSAVVYARGDSASDSLSVEIQTGGAVRIDSLTPSPWTPGITVTVAGSGFSTLPGGDTIAIDGVRATVSAATPTSLTVVVPPVGLSCIPYHEGVVTVRTGGALAADTVAIDADSLVTLAAGQSVNLGDLQGRCVGLGTPGALYRVTLTNAGNRVTSAVLATIRDSFPRPDGSAPPVTPPAPPGGGAPLPGVRTLDSIRIAAMRHRQLLQAVRAHSMRVGPAAPLLRAARQTAIPGAPAVMINGTALIRVPRVDRPDYCSSYLQVQARLAYEGRHVRIFEDVSSPFASSMDSSYHALGVEFDRLDYPTDSAAFGDPLVLDSLLERSGKVDIVFTPQVNRIFGAGPFVVDCDFYPEAIAPASNTAAVIYGPVPTAAGTGYSSYTSQAWWWLIQGEVMHELAYLTTIENRLGSGLEPEEPWLSEASALAGEEIWSRPFHTGARWKGAATYSATLYCEVRPGTPSCAGTPYAMFDAFALFYDFGQHHEQRTPLAAFDQSDASWLGSGWAFLRWAIDQYGSDEAAFLHSLTRDPATGIQNLADRTGEPPAQMLADWFMAWTLADAEPITTERPVFTFPSWDLVDIYRGMNTDFVTTFLGFPAAPRCCHDNFYTAVAADSIINMQPGGSAYFLFGNEAPPAQIIRLTGVDGPPLPGMEIQVLRVK